MYGPPLEVAPDIKRLRAAANNLLVDMCSTTLLSSATPHSAGATSRLITPCMLALHPLDDPLQRDLLVATLGTHPVLQASFLRSSPLCAVAPSASLRYIAASDLISKILGLPMSLDPACVLLAPGGGGMQLVAAAAAAVGAEFRARFLPTLSRQRQLRGGR